MKAKGIKEKERRCYDVRDVRPRLDQGPIGVLMSEYCSEEITGQGKRFLTAM